MVRRRNNTQSGAPAQPSAPIAGQTYGMADDQQQLAAAMPTPDNASAVVTPPAAPAAPVAPGASAPMTFADLVAAAQGSAQGAGLLTAGSARPNEPITAGLPIGAGPGPAALGFQVGSTPGQRFLRTLADRLGGDPYLESLADRVAR